jgi:hypothetical protein
MAKATDQSFSVNTDLPAETQIDVKKNSLESCPPCVMSFVEESGKWLLQSKVESVLTPAISGMKPKIQLTSGCRFKFSGDTEDAKVRENLTVESTPDQSNGQFHWSCPLRETPPLKVIFYGGCALVADAHRKAEARNIPIN